MKWIWLLTSIACEVVGTTLLKLSSDGSRYSVLYGFGTFVSYVACFTFFWQALKFFSLGTVYATWSGVSVSLMAIVGLIWFGDQLSLFKFVSFLLVIAGVVGLNMSGMSH